MFDYYEGSSPAFVTVSITFFVVKVFPQLGSGRRIRMLIMGLLAAASIAMMESHSQAGHWRKRPETSRTNEDGEAPS